MFSTSRKHYWRIAQGILYLILTIGMCQGIATADVLGELDTPGLKVWLSKSTQARFQLRIHAGTARQSNEPVFNAFTLENPRRLVIDVPNPTRVATKSIALDSPFVRGLRFGGHSGKSRIVVEMETNQYLDYQFQKLQSGEFEVTFHFPSSVVEKRDISPEALPASQVKAARIKEVEISPFRDTPQMERLIPARALPTQNEKRIAAKLPPSEEAANAQKKATQKVDPIRKPSKKLKQPAQSASARTKAYTFQGNDVQMVPVERKKSYSRIPRVEKKVPADSEGAAEKAPTLAVKKEAEERPLHADEAMLLTKADEVIAGKTRIDPQKELKEIDEALTANEPLFWDAMFVDQQPEDVFAMELLLGLLAVALLLLLLLRRKQLAGLFSEPPRSGVILQERIPVVLEHYRVLGCRETDTDDAIKTRYRHLVKVFHNDTLNSRELPDEVLSLTDEQFRKVQEAYESLREIRGFH